MPAPTVQLNPSPLRLSKKASASSLRCAPPPGGYNAGHYCFMPTAALTAWQIGWARRLRRLSDPALTVLVVLQLLALFLDLPLTDMGIFRPTSLLMLEVMTLASALLVVSWKRAAVIALLVSFFAGVGAAELRGVLASQTATVIDFAAKMMFTGVLTWVVGIQVFSPGRVTRHRIWGAVAIYLQISLLFAYSYLLIASQNPNAFSPPLVFHGPAGDILRGAHGGSQLVYFSLSTLTTTGYGDIVPVHPLARSLANLEGLIGQLFPATLLARLVTLELAERKP